MKKTFRFGFKTACSLATLFALSGLTQTEAFAQLPSHRVSSRTSFFIPQDEDDQKSSSDLDLGEEDDDSADEDRAPQIKRQPFGPWPRKGIRAIDIDVREKSFNAPEDRSGQLLNSPGGSWENFSAAPKTFAWAAPDIGYQPLYFEDVALERYGQTAPPYQQSVLSAVQMFKQTVLLPHQMMHDAPGGCDSPLGFCRPGNTVPYTIQRSYFGRVQR